MKNILSAIKKKLFNDQDFDQDNLRLKPIWVDKPKIKKMRPKFFLIIVLLITICASGIAQNKHRIPKRNKKTLQEVTVFSGLVVSWTNNENYLYDGFYLQTAGHKYLVKFPPNKANQLMTSIKPDNIIYVNGIEGISPFGEFEIKVVGIKADDKNIYDSISIVKGAPPIEELFDNKAKIKELKKDRKGKVNGFILNNNTILLLPAHVAKKLNQVAVVGTKISYTGLRKGMHIGEIPAVNDTILFCKTITINKIQYLTK